MSNDTILSKVTVDELVVGSTGAFVAGMNDPKYAFLVLAGVAAVGLVRRSAVVNRSISAQLARMDYDADEGTPAHARLLDAVRIDTGHMYSAANLLPAPDGDAPERKPAKQTSKKGKKASKPVGRLKGLLADFAASISDDDEVVETPSKRSERAKPVEEDDAPAAPVDDDEAWVAQASGSRPEGSERPAAALKVLTLKQVLTALNEQVDDYPHIFVVGNSGAGKTTLVQLLVGTRPGSVVILDPKRPKGWEGPKWGGLPYVSRDKQSGSYAPMVAALKKVVAEMDHRYNIQDEVSEPFQPLTVVLDEAKNSVMECEELATLYKKIVSIGREVGVRLVLISTSDRAGILGFSGEADSMDSFAWVRLGEFALNVQRDAQVRAAIKSRGGERYFWAVADMFGEWVPFENEKAFKLLGTLNLRREKAWASVAYNCQVTVKASEPVVVSAGRPSVKGTRQMQAVVVQDEQERPIVNGYRYTDDDLALLARLNGPERSVKRSADVSDQEVTEKSLVTSAPGEVQTSRSETGNLRTSLSADTTLQEAVLTFKSVPEGEREKLRSALKRFTENGQKVTDAIEYAFGNGGGPKFKDRSKWLQAAYTLYMASAKK